MRFTTCHNKPTDCWLLDENPGVFSLSGSSTPIEICFASWNRHDELVVKHATNQPLQYNN